MKNTKIKKFENWEERDEAYEEGDETYEEDDENYHRTLTTDDHIKNLSNIIIPQLQGTDKDKYADMIYNSISRYFHKYDLY